MRPGSSGAGRVRGLTWRAPQRGFAYVMLLAAVALIGLGLAVVGPRWAEAEQREQERMLLKVGELYAQAIASYYLASPGSTRRYPPDLQSLVLDTRFVGVKRHLRRLYTDPLNPHRPWGIVRAPDGGIQGIYSQDSRQPRRVVGLQTAWLNLPPARAYAEWLFVPRMPS
jgi:type II secretory pathway pseudopilin PulG